MNEYVAPREYEHFENGDRVYHRNRRMWGDFSQVDDVDPETAGVFFDGEGYLRVSRSQLQRTAEQ